MLVQEGLAQVSVIGNRVPRNIDEIEDAEYKAKEEGLGIWSKSLKLMSQTGTKKVE